MMLGQRVPAPPSLAWGTSGLCLAAFPPCRAPEPQPSSLSWMTTSMSVAQNHHGQATVDCAKFKGILNETALKCKSWKTLLSEQRK